MKSLKEKENIHIFFSLLRLWHLYSDSNSSRFTIATQPYETSRDWIRQPKLPTGHAP